MPLLADGLHNLVVGFNQETHHAGSGRLGGLASCHSGLTAWLCGRLAQHILEKCHIILKQMVVGLPLTPSCIQLTSGVLH